MYETIAEENRTVRKEYLLPERIIEYKNIENIQKLMQEKAKCVSFSNDIFTVFSGKSSYIILDFGKEISGCIRIITRECNKTAKFRLTYGESLSEAYSYIGLKNAMNDHSVRDSIITVSNMSDLSFSNTGFRFVRLELFENASVKIQNIFAVNMYDSFENEAFVETDDETVNKILRTAAYTLKLCCQNGYIWDGVKRDRLVWSGDLHQEIITSLYLFGDNVNIKNSLLFLKSDTPADRWMNNIPSYSAWWVINLCVYCSMTGNSVFFNENKDYAKSIIKHFNECINKNGIMNFGIDGSMKFFLDWPTLNTEDSVIGTACIICLMAEKYLEIEKNNACDDILRKLSRYTRSECKTKQARAFQILAGGSEHNAKAFFENGGVRGFSTFTVYYILTAYSMSGGRNPLKLIKDYFGAMLSLGATTFWEDFDISWLENSSGIDKIPSQGQNDIHGDFGNYCYKGYRHSLCHGWASGVFSFIIENIAGIRFKNSGKTVEINPDLCGLKYMNVTLPTKYGNLNVKISDGNVYAQAPSDLEIIK